MFPAPQQQIWAQIRGLVLRQVCSQFQQVLELTLTDMILQNSVEHPLIVCAVCNLLDTVNVTVFRSFGAEMLGPAMKQDKLPTPTQIDMRLLKFPCILHSILFRKVCLQQLKNLNRLFLKPISSATFMLNFQESICHSKWLHVQQASFH
jgi:hypothetical protein